MNESRHPIDDLFRDGLDQYSVDAPMHVWESIDQKRTPVYKLSNNFKQNRRWYLSVASGLILMSSAAMFFLNENLSSEKLSLLGTADTEIQKAEANTGTDNGTGANSQKGNTATEGTLTAPASEHAMEGTSGTGSNEHVQPAVTPTTPKSVSGVEAIRETPVKTVPRNNNPVLPTEKAEKPEVVVPNYTLPAEKKTGEKENNDNNNGGAPYTPGNTNPQEPKKDIIPPVLEPEPVVAVTPQTDAPEGTEDKKIPPTDPKWGIELMGSYDIVNRNIRHNDPTYVNLRNAAEKVNNGFSFQLRGQYMPNKVLAFRSGIGFSRISETLNYNQPTSYQEIENRQVTGYIVDPINGPQMITYTVKDTVTKTRFTPVNSRNTYTFIDIPLLVNYTFLDGEKFSFSAGGGPLVNLVFMQKGKILNPVNSEVIDLNSTANPFRTTAGMNLMLNLGAAYHINREFDILFEPGARFGMGSLTSKGLDMTQRYSTINLFTGVRYKF